MVEQVLIAAIGLSIPLVFAAVGEIVSEKAGVVNIGLEGMLLTGAFTGVLGAHLAGSLAVGFLTAIAGGMLVAGLHALVSVRLGADQIVSGIALNLLALGATSYVLDAYFDGQLKASLLRPVAIPVLSEVPFVGPILFDQNAGVYVMYVVVAAVVFVLPKMSWWLKVVACGERPSAANALGVDVIRTRSAAVLVTGALAGLGGGIFALSVTGAFQDNMIQGRGYIALAAVMFGNWRAAGAVLGASLFGLTDAIRLQGQGLGVDIHPQIMDMLPYVVTLGALALLGTRSRAPRFLAIPYFRSGT